MVKTERATDSLPSAGACAAGFVLGREGFARISAVEGIVLTPDMREAMESFDREGLTAAERRRAILKRFTSTERDA
jgi:hypothetical protein